MVFIIISIHPINDERFGHEGAKTLRNTDGVGFRLPYWLSLIFGYAADAIAKVSENLLISSIRVKNLYHRRSLKVQKNY